MTLAAIAVMLTIELHGFQSTAWAQSTTDSVLGLAETSPSTIERSLPPAPTASQTSLERLLPSQWSRPNPILSKFDTVAPIYLDGRTLFYLSAPAVEGEQPAEIRAQTIQQRLNQLATTQRSNPQVVTIVIDEPTTLPVIFVNEQEFLTVTNLDAQLNGYIRPNEYAIILRNKIEDAFDQYRAERQPQFLQQQAQKAIGIFASTLLLLFCSKYIQQRLQKRQKGLVNTDTQLGQTTVSARPPMVIHTIANTVDSVLDLTRAQLGNRQKRKLNEMAIGLLLLLQIGLCISGALWILELFPYSRWITALLRYWIAVPTKILLIAGLAYVALRLVSLTVDKVCLALQEGAQWAPEYSQRLSLRFFTFSQVAKGIAGSVIFGIMGLAMLATAGIQIGPLLAGAGIVGVGISLAAQGLIKDVINGFLILFEDQFGIGDVVAIGDVTGSVEGINLRITQLRNTEGHLITIPNSQIDIVQNLSKDWSQVDLSITVGPNNDIEQALALFKTTATDMAADPEWQQLILEPPDLLGIDDINSTGITLRLLLKTQPLKQWRVARELRRRIKHKFDDAGIRTGIPQERLELSWEEGPLPFTNDPA